MSTIIVIPTCFLQFISLAWRTAFTLLKYVQHKPSKQRHVFDRVIHYYPGCILIEYDIQNIVLTVVSRPREPPPQPLAERYVNLSIHTAPIRKTDLPFLPANGQTVAGSSLLFLPEILTSESCADAAFCIFAAPTLSGLCLCVEIVNIMLNDYNVRSSQSNRL